MTAILEIISPDGFHQYHKPGDTPLLLGRGYDCDIIIPDEYLSAQHLRIWADEAGQYCISDCNSENGVYIEAANGSRSRISQETVIPSGSCLHAGKTAIFLHASDTRVAPAKKIHHAGNGVKSFILRHSWAPPLITFITLVVMDAYLDHSQKEDYSELVANPFAALMLVSFWSSGWAFLGRMTTHNANFFKHVGIFSSIACIVMILNALGNSLAYSIEGTSFTGHLLDGLYPALVGVVLFSLFTVMTTWHLKYSTRLGKGSRWKMASILPVTIIIFLSLADYFDENGPDGNGIYGNLMLPLSMRVADIKTQKEFINEISLLEKIAREEAAKSKDWTSKL